MPNIPSVPTMVSTVLNWYLQVMSQCNLFKLSSLSTMYFVCDWSTMSETMLNYEETNFCKFGPSHLRFWKHSVWLLDLASVFLEVYVYVFLILQTHAMSNRRTWRRERIEMFHKLEFGTLTDNGTLFDFDCTVIGFKPFLSFRSITLSINDAKLIILNIIN